MPSGQVMGSSVTPCKYGSANDVIGVRVEEVSASTGGVSSQKSPLLSSLTSPLQQPESESASVSAHKSAERRRFTARPP